MRSAPLRKSKVTMSKLAHACISRAYRFAANFVGKYENMVYPRTFPGPADLI
jgi:hypothetical protein